MTRAKMLNELIDLMKRAHVIAAEIEPQAGFDLVSLLDDLGVKVGPARDDAPIDESPYDAIVGTVYSTMYGLPIKEDGPETLDAIRWEFPAGEKDFRTVRLAFETITLEQIEALREIKRREVPKVVN